MTNKLSRAVIGFVAVAVFLSTSWATARAASSRVAVPQGALAGLHQEGPANGAVQLHLAFELQPKADLDGLAARMSDPADPAHRNVLSREAFVEKFGRLPDARALVVMLKAAGGTDVALAGNGLVAGGQLRIDQAERLFGVRWQKWTDGQRTVLAPDGPLNVPAAGLRDVRGAVVATIPRLADTRASFTYFRGDWYEPARFRSMTDSVANGGTGQRIVLVEDVSDGFDLNDVRRFVAAEGAPPGADARRVTERSFVFKAASVDCGRDDRGQEAALDVDSAITTAPLADVAISYDDICTRGNDGTLALARALDLDPTVIVFPFVIGPADGPIGARYGATPIPILEALVRGSRSSSPRATTALTATRRRGSSARGSRGRVSRHTSSARAARNSATATASPTKAPGTTSSTPAAAAFPPSRARRGRTRPATSCSRRAT